MKEMFINKCIGWLWITQGVLGLVGGFFGGVVEMDFWWGLVGVIPRG